MVRRHILRYLEILLYDCLETFQTIRRIICASLGEFLCAKLKKIVLLDRSRCRTKVVLPLDIDFEIMFVTETQLSGTYYKRSHGNRYHRINI